ncbi:NACHT domain-containing protein [Streptomyces sp. 8N616]
MIVGMAASEYSGAAGKPRLLRWLTRIRRDLHTRRVMGKGFDQSRKWRVPKRGLRVPAVVLTICGAVILLALAGLALVTVIDEPETGLWSILSDAEDRCQNHGLSCGILSTIFMPLLTLALATVTYLVFRFTRVRKSYLRKAHRKPHELVETAGSIFGNVVGRDQLCSVLMEDLRDRQFRRTHVVVGGVGTGKTALMVLLTEKLAAQHAVPIPLRLRDAGTDLDFHQLAFDRFCREVQADLRSSSEGEKVWRRLCQQGRIVVLADGLEEAMTDGDLAEERATVIRLAIRRANDEELPLIIASRPHDSLRGMEASVTDLEPLSEEAALSYIAYGVGWEDRQRLDWIVETAGIAEAPMYLQIASDLHRERLLEHALPGSADEAVETRGGDQAALRFNLLDTWIKALIIGRFHPELTLSQEERRVTIEYLSALACVGLANDASEVKFADLVDGYRPSKKPTQPTESDEPKKPPYAEICRELKSRLKGSKLDIRLAATWGAQMGLVEIRGDRVRFQHSIMQAHLGARFMNAVIHQNVPERAERGTYFPGALEDPGRELLIAMVLYSRTLNGSCTHEQTPTGEGTLGGGEAWCPVSGARDILVNAAGQARKAGKRQTDGQEPHGSDNPLRLSQGHHTKALELYTAALEIDSVDVQSKQKAIAWELLECWPDLRARDTHTLQTAKALLVRRFGDALRGLARRGNSNPAYKELFTIASLEPSYAIRVAIAQEIGAGGDVAFAALHPCLRGPEEADDQPVKREKDWQGTLWEEQQQDIEAEMRSEEPSRAEGRIVRQKRELKEQEKKRDEDLKRECEERDAEERTFRNNILCAWLIPLLVGSVTTKRHHDTPFAFLESWVQRVGAGGENHGGSLDLTVEVALAQGFKFAANRRHRHPHARPAAREYLAEQAWEMLKRTRFWFSRLTLLHALTLWALPDGPHVPPPERGHGSDPAEQVRQWLALPDGERQHPFVEAAAELSVWTLETRRPERFMWIDESGVVAHVGSETAPQGESRKHHLWIPPSTGWSALHPSARQLLADVLLLLNLAERGDWPKDRLRRLHHTDRPDLPPCLTHDRSPLAPSRTVVSTATSQPGSNCRDDCSFELCPYPPAGLEGHRVELNAAFCRAQATQLSRSLFARRAMWQRKTDVTDLRQFWELMGKRGQPAT